MNFWSSFFKDMAVVILLLLSTWGAMAGRIPGLLLIQLTILLWMAVGIGIVLWEVLGGEMNGYRSLRHWFLAGLLWPWVLNEVRKMNSD